MTEDEKTKLNQFFTWELMRLGVIADDARISYDAIQNIKYREKWLVARSRLEEAQEIEKLIFALFA